MDYSEKIEEFVEDFINKLQKFLHLELWEVKICPHFFDDERSKKQETRLVRSDIKAAKMETTVMFFPEKIEEYEGEEELYFAALAKDIVFEISALIVAKPQTALIDRGLSPVNASLICSDVTRFLCEVCHKNCKPNNKIFKKEI